MILTPHCSRVGASGWIAHSKLLNVRSSSPGVVAWKFCRSVYQARTLRPDLRVLRRLKAVGDFNVGLAVRTPSELGVLGSGDEPLDENRYKGPLVSQV